MQSTKNAKICIVNIPNVFAYFGRNTKHSYKTKLDNVSFIKGTPISKAQDYLYENLPVQTKMVILSRILILPAKLLYEQLIHLIQISLRPKSSYK